MADVTTCLILFPNFGDLATLSGGSYQIPLQKVQTRILQEVARTTDLLLSSTQMEIDYDKARATRAVILTYVNVSVSSRKRVRVFSSTGEEVGGSGDRTSSDPKDYWEDIYPREQSTASMRWGDENFWSGRPVADDLEGTNQSIITLLDEEVFADRVTVEIDDRNNPIKYLDFGRLFTAGEYEPSNGFAFGAALQFDARSTSQRSLGGTLYHDERIHPRVKTITIENLTQQEAYTQVYEIQRRAKTTREVFYVENPLDLLNRQRVSFLARLKTLPAIVNTEWDLCEVSFDIEEII